jgi:hypothetical protein
MHRPGPEEWKRLIQEYAQSGLQQKEFVAKHDLSLGTFQYWLYKRGKSDSKFDGNSSPRFLPVQVVASPASKTRGAQQVVEAALLSGTILRFVVGTDTQYLAELFAALG